MREDYGDMIGDYGDGRRLRRWEKITAIRIEIR